MLPLRKDEFSFLLFGKFTQYWQNIFPFGFIEKCKPRKILFPSRFEVSILLCLFHSCWEGNHLYERFLHLSFRHLPCHFWNSVTKSQHERPPFSRCFSEVDDVQFAVESTEGGLGTKPGPFPHRFQNDDCKCGNYERKQRDWKNNFIMLPADLTNVKPRSTG